LLSAIIWVFFRLLLFEGMYPPTKWGFRNSIMRWLDLPIALSTQLLPCNEFAIDVWFTVRCPNESGGLARFFWNHMRVGVPTYMLIFYLPASYRAGHGWWRRRRSRPAAGVPP
jgi:hypothetical protein